MLAVVYARRKIPIYAHLDKSSNRVISDHSDITYLVAKKDSKAEIAPWVHLHQEVPHSKVIDTNGAENLTAGIIFPRLENPMIMCSTPKGSVRRCCTPAKKLLDSSSKLATIGPTGEPS
ncbi:hypothetical protein Tco_0726250 [Tanacetum coccineum]|uniref:Reverse transcriptase RNase H-like domain-containing protein n=1 Tax=Tanacetum coccineum TaxID=301880 RepID=A0ABQ4YF56_9ASTR